MPWTAGLDELARTDLNAADVTLVEVQNRDTEPRAQMDRLQVIDPVVRGPRSARCFGRSPASVASATTTRTWRATERCCGTRQCRRPAVDLTGQVHIDHRTAYRTSHRRDASMAYYELRDLAGIETREHAAALPCPELKESPLHG